MPRDSDSFILQLYARTPPPCRDYCGLTVKKDEVVLNIWNITYGPHVYPKRQKRSLEDFSQDKHFQSEVNRLFGEHVLEYVASIARNERNLRNLPEKIFLHVLKYLATKDILNLSQTSRIMFELCNTDNSWKLLFRKYFKRHPTPKDAVLAERFGWKDTLMQKMEITESNKNGRKAKVPVMTSKTVTPPKQIKNNIKINIHTINDKIQKVVGNNHSNIIDKRELPSKVRNTAIVSDQKKEFYNKVQSKSFAQLRGIEKNSQIVAKNTNIKNKIDTAKSLSTLIAPKSPLLNNLKVNQPKSIANINNIAHTRQKTKNCLNLNGVKSTNTDIKIDIPKILEGSAACHAIPKTKSVFSKPDADGVKRKASLLKKIL